MISLLVCPSCKNGTLRYLTTERTVVQCYDYKKIILTTYWECDQCGQMRDREFADTWGTRQVHRSIAERIRRSVSSSSATTVEPKSEPSVPRLTSRSTGPEAPLDAKYLDCGGARDHFDRDGFVWHYNGTICSRLSRVPE